MTRARDVADSTTKLSVDGTVKLDGNYPVGLQNVALGDVALGALQSGGNYNTGIGYDALGDLTTGDHNVGIGREALRQTTTASENTGIGSGALVNNTTGEYNTSVGRQSLFKNTTADNNTAVGYRAGYNTTTGESNVFIGGRSWDSGYGAGNNNTTGNYNIAIGSSTLGNNTTASNNTAVGHQAAYYNTTGTYNAFFGLEAGKANTTGSYNTVVGYKAGITTTTASFNTYLGTFAGELGSGGKNTFVGNNAGVYVSSGANNTIIGRYDGNQGGLDIRTSSNWIVLSDGDGNPRLRINSSGHLLIDTSSDIVSSKTCTSVINQNNNTGFAIGIDSMRNDTSTSGGILFRNNEVAGTFNACQFFASGNSAVGSIVTSNTSTTYNTSSDYRLKENVVELTGATERLKQLNPSRFNFIADADTTVDGFLAHEVQDIVPEAITGTKDEVDADGNPVYQGIDQSKLVPLLVATIQELEARITALEGA